MGTKPIQIIYLLYQLIQAIGMTVLHALFAKHAEKRPNQHVCKPYGYCLAGQTFSYALRQAYRTNNKTLDSEGFYCNHLYDDLV
jgi:hypothetical protein